MYIDTCTINTYMYLYTSIFKCIDIPTTLFHSEAHRVISQCIYLDIYFDIKFVWNTMCPSMMHIKNQTYCWRKKSCTS